MLWFVSMIQQQQLIITARKRGCGKVMFLHVSVRHSVYRGRGSPWKRPLWIEIPPGQRPRWTEATPGQTSPRQRPPPQKRPPYGKERVVRILFECILVCTILFQLTIKQECIPVGCVPPQTVAVGGLHQAPPQTRLPQSRHPPRTRSPKGRHPPPPEQAPPRSRHPPRAGTPCGQTHTCRHITLPQTLFADGNKVKVM